MSQPAIAKIEFLPDAEGRMVIFVYRALPEAGLDYARLFHARQLRPGESALGVSYEQIAAAGVGRIVPDGKGGWRVEAHGPGAWRW